MIKDYAKPLSSKKKSKIRFPLLGGAGPRKNQRKKPKQEQPNSGVQEPQRGVPLGMKSPVIRTWRRLTPLQKAGATAAALVTPFVISHAVNKAVMQPKKPIETKRPTIALKDRKFRRVPKAEVMRRVITPETIEAWKRMVAGEVATSLIEKGASLDSVSNEKKMIARMIAESVMHRQNQPAWKNMSYLDIIKQPWAYQTHDSSSYEKEIAFQPQAYKLAEKVVDELIQDGKPKHEPTTHYFMRRKYALDRNGKIIKRNSQPMLSTKPDPYWTKEKYKDKNGRTKYKKLTPVRVFEYNDSKSKNKGPMKVYFYHRKN